jgi:Tfp pilus assembly protein PilF
VLKVGSSSIIVFLLCWSGCAYQSIPPVNQPDKARQQIEKGDRYLMSSDYGRAYSAFKNAYMLNATASALVGMGTAQLGLGDKSASEKYFLDALAQDPNNAYAYGNLGVLSGMRGDWRRARYCYEKAIERDPSAFEFLNNLAVVLHRSGEKRSEVLELLLQAQSFASHPRIESNIKVVEKGVR